MRRDQACLVDRHAHGTSGRLVGLAGGFESARIVGGEGRGEQIPQTSALQLRFLDLARRVGERRETKPFVAQPLERATYVGVRRQSSHVREDGLFVRGGQRHIVATRDDP